MEWKCGEESGGHSLLLLPSFFSNPGSGDECWPLSAKPSPEATASIGFMDGQLLLLAGDVKAHQVNTKQLHFPGAPLRQGNVVIWKVNAVT